MPLNQNETIVICAVIKDSQNIPNKALPASIPPKESAATQIAMINCATVTPRDNITTAALYYAKKLPNSNLINCKPNKYCCNDRWEWEISI